jgi:hypothetical protein
MATNLVSLVMQFLTPDMIGRIASALGIDRSKAESAIGAAVPALLAGLSGIATQPGGPQKLADAARQPIASLDNFARTLGSGQGSVVEKGTQMVSSLLGGQDQTTLENAVGKFAGLGQGAISSLLGMLAPVVLGTVSNASGGAFDGRSIANLLVDQKNNIAAALPSGFRDLLGGTNLLNALGGAARTATAGVTAAARTASTGVNDATRTAASAARTVGAMGRQAVSTAATSRNWVYWVIALAILAAVVIYFLARPTEQVAQQGAPAAQSLVVGGVDIGKQVTDGVSSLNTALAGVTDAASAQAALPKLTDITTQINKVSDTLGQLSADQRKTLAGLVAPLLSTLNPLFDKVLAIPGVADVLKPTIDQLKTKLAALAA